MTKKSFLFLASLLMALFSSINVSIANGRSVLDTFGVTVADLSDDTFDKAVQGGFKIVRLDLQWAEVEQRKGVYNWELYDEVMRDLNARKLHAMFILDFNNPLYNPSRDPMDAIDTREEIEGFRNFAVAAVRRYESNSPIWEIYNEPNRKEFWKDPDPLEYVALVKAVVPAMRKVDRKIIVIGPALGHAPDANPDLIDKLDYAYLEKTFQAGLLDYINAVSIHPYPDEKPEYVSNIYSKVRTLIKTYAPPNRRYAIVSSEWGYSTLSGVTPNEQTHANYWVRLFLVNASEGIAGSIGYKLEYTTIDPTLSPYEFGFMLFNADGQPKLAFKQIQDMTNTLKGLRFIKRHPSTSTTYLLEFASTSRTVIAAWVTGASKEAKIYGKTYLLNQKPIFVLK
jgi:polysaccharide biosynthesis protein PslG